MTRPPGDDPELLQAPSAADRRPDVIVEFLFDRGLIFVVVRNIGAGPAVEVSVRFEPALHGLNGSRDMSAQALFRSIAFLGPGREIATLLDRSDSFFGRKPATRISAEVRYSDREGRQYQDSIRHDLEIFRDLAFLSDTSDKPTALHREE